jgi:hypothetical protein
MDHNEAIATQATERYLLGELGPEVRDQFEEHLFECQQCAVDLRAAAIFVEQSKVVLDTVEVPRKPVPASGWGWMQWLRPAVVIPTMATLLAVIGYQEMSKSARPIEGPQLVSSLSLVAANARGANTQEASLSRGKPLIVFVDVPPVAQAGSYAVDFHNPTGSLLWTLPVSAEAAKDTLALQIPAVQGPVGTYSLVIRAIDAGGQSTEVAHYPFAVGAR